MSTLKIGSLFSGMGMLDEAVAEVFGATTAWVSDIDKGACKILAHRYPDVPNLGDITAIDWAGVEPIDILTGGSPCQDLSHAGKRAGMTEGTRSNLWVAMREAIAQLKPTYVIWENVRGAYSAAADSDLEPCAGCVGDATGTHLRALGRVLGDLSELGFDARWHGLRAADVGACHGRYRVFVVAHAQGYGWDEGRAESTRLVGRPDVAERGDDAVMLLPTPSVADVTGGHERRGGARSDELLLNGVVRSLLPTPTSRDHKDHMIRREPHRPDDVDTLSRALTGVKLLPTPMVGSTSPAAHGQISGQFRDAMDAALADFGQYAAAVNRWAQVLGRPAPAPTEPTGRNGAHRLSARFVEWMQGAPEGWITDVPGVTRNEALKALGNGVVRQQAVAALRLMLAQERAA